MILVNDEVNSASSSDDEGGDINVTEENSKQHVKSNKDDPQGQNHTKTNTDSNSKPEDCPEILLKMLMEVSQKLCRQIKWLFHLIMVDLGGYQLFDRFAQWCVQHPHLAICLLAAGLVASLPVLLFMAFALSTIVMTFTGFLVLEGTLLTILTMIMLGLLGAVGIVLIFFALVGVTTYLGVSQVYDMYGSTETERTNLRNVMQRNDRNFTTQTAPLPKNSNRTSQDENVID
ncbi:uncharacterized protein LOC111681475 [Lucilia cuprina]|uniref:uncharacterized protein LOC111681475 n=1 Tax=Lucilia cuprina TaxID=7375 RepID=UPI001F054846|nr:uncharacterized protein LOC111681475 [Lucilia cuprina]